MVKDSKPLYKPFKSKKAGKKYSVYVKSPSGNKKLIHFGAAGMDDWRSGKASPAQRKSFRARHNCANPGPKTKARYWSCRKW